MILISHKTQVETLFFRKFYNFTNYLFTNFFFPTFEEDQLDIGYEHELCTVPNVTVNEVLCP